jgi:hypothetical protein
MTSRERLRKALRRREPDRVPIDFGQDFHNGINEVAYRNLQADVPPANIVALFDTAYKAGRYPPANCN